ncbi:MAG TPA: hypothetical protein VGI14_21845 [Casimicrobiaceae bacterium]|jgi:hypothetical protein
MYASSRNRRQLRRVALAGAIGLAFVATASQAAVSQSPERKNMQRSGHTDLQGRPSYQPNVIQYPNGRWYLFVGQHSGVPVQAGCADDRLLPNPLNGNACENNGTMIIDVTDVNNPVEKFLIPAPLGGQAQMTRMCRASKLPNAPHTSPERVYLLRNVQANDPTISGYEVWDVTDPTAPFMTSSINHIRNTHKDWWECDTGIVYAPGSRDATLTSTPWRQGQAMLILDWSNPTAAPHFVRQFGLPGGQPNGTGTIPNSLHGAISTEEHPMKGQPLARAAGPDDVIGNRIYAAWGVGDDGIMTIIDRKKLLPPPWGTWEPKKSDSAENPDEDELIGPDSPTVGYFMMSPDEGGHTSMPVFGLKPKSFQKFNEFATRDIVVLASEATADGREGRCNEAPHATYIVDVTVENSITSPPGTRVEHDPYQGPMVNSTLWVDPTFGERYPRGNYCARGARFGTHSSEENFDQPLYGKLTAIAYFNGGVRIYDIREPYLPRQVAFYVPFANAKTDPDGYMTNNVEIDKRGNVYIVDRNGAGMDILQLTGCALTIENSNNPNASCPAIQ